MRGGPIPYSASELAFVQARQSMRRRDLHAAFAHEFGRSDVTAADIKALCSRNGWSAGRKRWAPQEDAQLRELYPNMPTKDVASRMGRTLSAINGRADLLDLRKSEAYLASPAACRLRRGDNRGGATRFKKGQTPANKGLRRPGWAPGRMKETQFAKGVRQGVAVKLYKPIGTERMSKDGYLERKVNDGWPLQRRWRAVHLVRWEEVNGPVPKGMALKSIDSNRLNTDPSNWVPVSRAMLPRLSGKYGRGYDAAPTELKPTIMAVAQLEHAAMTRKRRQA